MKQPFIYLAILSAAFVSCKNRQVTLNDMPKVLRDVFLKKNPDSSKLVTMFNKDRERMLLKDWEDEMLRLSVCLL